MGTRFVCLISKIAHHMEKKDIPDRWYTRHRHDKYTCSADVYLSIDQAFCEVTHAVVSRGFYSPPQGKTVGHFLPRLLAVISVVAGGFGNPTSTTGTHDTLRCECFCPWERFTTELADTPKLFSMLKTLVLSHFVMWMSI